MLLLKQLPAKAKPGAPGTGEGEEQKYIGFVSTMTGKKKIILVFTSRFSVQFSFHEAIFEGDHDIKKWKDVNLMRKDWGGGGGGGGRCML